MGEKTSRDPLKKVVSVYSYDPFTFFFPTTFYYTFWWYAVIL